MDRLEKMGGAALLAQYLRTKLEKANAENAALRSHIDHLTREPTDEDVERVARAMWDDDHASLRAQGRKYWQWDEIDGEHPGTRDSYHRHARAAIEAFLRRG